MFANPELAPDSLPSAESLEWQALHPRFVRRLQAQRLIYVAVALVFLTAGQVALVEFGEAHWLRPWMPVVVWGAIALWALRLLLWPTVDVPRRAYAVRDKDIVYKSGVWWRTVKAVPFNRVQHAVTGSTPLDRRFGLANLAVYTAGGELRISGLGQDIAERLRVYIVAKLALQEPVSDGDRL